MSIQCSTVDFWSLGPNNSVFHSSVLTIFICLNAQLQLVGTGSEHRLNTQTAASQPMTMLRKTLFTVDSVSTVSSSGPVPRWFLGSFWPPKSIIAQLCDGLISELDKIAMLLLFCSFQFLFNLCTEMLPIVLNHDS